MAAADEPEHAHARPLRGLDAGSAILDHEAGGRGDGHPIGRMGIPADMVGAAVFLASADADYVVAQTLNVDGGNWMS